MTTKTRTIADLTADELSEELRQAQSRAAIANPAELYPYLPAAQARIEAEVQRLQAKGILDGNRQVAPLDELPDDMREGSNQEC